MNSDFSDIKIINLPSSKVIACKKVGTEPENEAINKTLEYAKENQLKDFRVFGFDLPVSDDERNQRMRGYEAWLTVQENFTGTTNNEITIKKLHGGEFAVLRIFNPFENPFRKIPAGWHTLHNWLLNHNYEASNSICLEEVGNDESGEYMDIFIKITVK